VGRAEAPTFDIPGIHVAPANKNPVDSVSGASRSRAIRLGKDDVANLAKQVLDASKSSEIESCSH
jgi:hypothetical protein